MNIMFLTLAKNLFGFFQRAPVKQMECKDNNRTGKEHLRVCEHGGE